MTTGSTTSKKATIKKVHALTAKRLANHVDHDKHSRMQALGEKYFSSELEQTEKLFAITQDFDEDDPKYAAKLIYQARAKLAQINNLFRIAQMTAGAVNGHSKNIKEESILAKELVSKARARLAEAGHLTPYPDKPDMTEQGE